MFERVKRVKAFFFGDALCCLFESETLPRGIKRISSKGTLIGSREPSAHGGSHYGKPLSTAESAEVAAALYKLEKAN